MSDNNNNNSGYWARVYSTESGAAKNKRSSMFSMFSLPSFGNTAAQQQPAKEDHNNGKDDVDDVSDMNKKPTYEYYDVQNLRIPDVIDEEDGNYLNKNNNNNNTDDLDQIMDDPYAEFRQERYPEDSMAQNEKDKKRSFILGAVSKLLFLLGALFFLAVAIKDYKLVKALQDYGSLEEEMGLLDLSDDDKDPFHEGQVEDSATYSFSLEDELNQEESNKSERAGSDLLFRPSDEGGRRRGRHLQTNWYTLYWESLPADIKEAAALLGYDQDKWDNAEPVYTDRLYWDQLSPQQQDAAYLVFGYTESSWNDYVSRFMAALGNGDGDSAPTVAPVGFISDTWAPTAAPTYEDENSEPTASPDGFWTTSEGDKNEDAERGEPEENVDDYYGAPSDGDGDVSEEGTADEGNPPFKPFSNRTENEVSSFTGYNINLRGNSQLDAWGREMQVLYILAAICFLFVGILDGYHQQLGFHIVMASAGAFALLAGSLARHKDTGFNVCHSFATHLFLFQAILLAYSRVFLSYDKATRKILGVADGSFVCSALINAILSYFRYFNKWSEGIAMTSIFAACCWVFAGLIYIGLTLLLCKQHSSSWWRQAGDEDSLQDSCNVVLNGDGDCEISFCDPKERSGGQSPVQKRYSSNK